MTTTRPSKLLICLDHRTVRELLKTFEGGVAVFDCVRSDNGKAGAKDVMSVARYIRMIFAKVET